MKTKLKACWRWHNGEMLSFNNIDHYSLKNDISMLLFGEYKNIKTKALVTMLPGVNEKNSLCSKIPKEITTKICYFGFFNNSSKELFNNDPTLAKNNIKKLTL